jgi:hypothetical protein
VCGKTGWMKKIEVTKDVKSYDITFTPGAIVKDEYEVDCDGYTYKSTEVREGGCESIFETEEKG